MSDDSDGRNRGEIKNAREKNKERFQKRQDHLSWLVVSVHVLSNYLLDFC